jgi:hypothetical protein
MDTARHAQEARRDFESVSTQKFSTARQYVVRLESLRALRFTELGIIRNRVDAATERCVDKYSFIMRLILVCELLAAVAAVVVAARSEDDLDTVAETTEHGGDEDNGDGQGSMFINLFAYSPSFISSMFGELHMVARLVQDVTVLVDSIGSLGRMALRGLGLSTVVLALFALLAVESIVAPILVL